MQNNDLKTWDDGALEYLEIASEEKDAYKKYVDTPQFISLLGDIKGKKILDIGCGDGTLCSRLQKVGAMVTGLDGSEQMISVAKKLHQDCDFVVSDLISDNFNLDSQFDMITSKMMLMNIKSIKKLSLNMYKILVTNGFFVIDIVHPSYPPISRLIKNKSRYEELDYHEEKLGSIEFGGKKFAYYYRPLETYINEIQNSGFQLTKISEPHPSRDLTEKYPELRAKQKLPVSIHMLFKKL